VPGSQEGHIGRTHGDQVATSARSRTARSSSSTVAICAAFACREFEAGLVEDREGCPRVALLGQRVEDARRQLYALEPVAGGEVVNLRPGQLEADVRGAEAVERGPNLAVCGCS
jgi:hypothetical protein